MPDIILPLTDEEQSGLLLLVDSALRANGRGALTAAIHWERKIHEAQQAAAQVAAKATQDA